VRIAEFKFEISFEFGIWDLFGPALAGLGFGTWDFKANTLFGDSLTVAGLSQR